MHISARQTLLWVFWRPHWHGQLFPHAMASITLEFGRPKHVYRVYGLWSEADNINTISTLRWRYWFTGSNMKWSPNTSFAEQMIWTFAWLSFFGASDNQISHWTQNHTLSLRNIHVWRAALDHFGGFLFQSWLGRSRGSCVALLIAPKGGMESTVSTVPTKFSRPIWVCVPLGQYAVGYTLSCVYAEGKRRWTMMTQWILEYFECLKDCSRNLEWKSQNMIREPGDVPRVDFRHSTMFGWPRAPPGIVDVEGLVNGGKFM